MKTAIEIGNELLAARPQRELTPDEASILVRLFCLERAGLVDLGDAEPPFSYQVLAGRLDMAKVPYEPFAAMFLASCSDRPGTAVLYAAVIAALAAKKNGERVSLTDLTSLDAFGMGVPDEDALHKVWEGQKINDGKGPDNMLDRKEAWE
jgi:hypothetical protein